MLHPQNLKVTTVVSTDATIGRIGFVGINIKGLDAVNTITLLDGTAIKYAFIVPITQSKDVIFSAPVAFENLIVDATGTAPYSITYAPRP